MWRLVFQWLSWWSCRDWYIQWRSMSNLVWLVELGWMLWKMWRWFSIAHSRVSKWTGRWLCRVSNRWTTMQSTIYWNNNRWTTMQSKWSIGTIVSQEPPQTAGLKLESNTYPLMKQWWNDALLTVYHFLAAFSRCYSPWVFDNWQARNISMLYHQRRLHLYAWHLGTTKFSYFAYYTIWCLSRLLRRKSTISPMGHWWCHRSKLCRSWRSRRRYQYWFLHSKFQLAVILSGREGRFCYNKSVTSYMRLRSISSILFFAKL